MDDLVNQFEESGASAPSSGRSEHRSGVSVLRDFIEGGQYASGDRLPSERDLIVALGMSRSALRKALDALEHEGAIWRHVGKGTFVSGQGGPASARAIDELSQQMTPVRMIQARLCVEPALAREAAIHASSSAIARMKNAIAASRAATTWSEYETQDDLFHREVAKASDNILLLTLFDQFNAVRRAVSGGAVVRATARPTADHRSFAEHDLIASAIEGRDPHAAHDAMRKHIGSVSARLFGEV
ncbi:MAG: FCD domain-containing protein [Albidovulum sp.]